MLLFVFLARDKSKDVRRVREICDYLMDLKIATTLLIFPEGTNWSRSNQVKSLAFAKKEGLAEYQYVLHPKVRPVWFRGRAVEAVARTLRLVTVVVSVAHCFCFGNSEILWWRNGDSSGPKMLPSAFDSCSGKP